uniref:Uncharacterized protein n=1 Tax=Nelumbo nucifera TaxID=4432 RepID=A0A822Z3E2_NELNU|nr:TPA_asm: hypothetical protein HUJ06_006668 [Nelumbo nucifera]
MVKNNKAKSAYGTINSQPGAYLRNKSFISQRPSKEFFVTAMRQKETLMQLKNILLH